MQGGKGERGPPGAYGPKGEKGDRVSSFSYSLPRVTRILSVTSGRFWGQGLERVASDLEVTPLPDSVPGISSRLCG